VVLVAAGVALPARADTRSDLQAARNRLDQAEGDLRTLIAEWQRTEASLARAEDAEQQARREIAELERTLAEAQRQLGLRAREMFMAGPSPTVTALLTSGSVGEVADRWEFASSIAQGDQDLATRVSVQTELLRRQRAKLQQAVKEKTAAVADLQRQKGLLELQLPPKATPGSASIPGLSVPARSRPARWPARTRSSTRSATLDPAGARTRGST
jgi:peptidoglycan hydrolase CwlO-like protein